MKKSEQRSNSRKHSHKSVREGLGEAQLPKRGLKQRLSHSLVQFIDQNGGCEERRTKERQMHTRPQVYAVKAWWDHVSSAMETTQPRHIHQLEHLCPPMETTPHNEPKWPIPPSTFSAGAKCRMRKMAKSFVDVCVGNRCMILSAGDQHHFLQQYSRYLP